MLANRKSVKYTGDDLALPNALATTAGKRVESPETWKHERRPEILELFRTHVYGQTPTTPVKLDFDVFDEELKALNGRAIRKQVAIEATCRGKRLRMELLMYLPPVAKDEPVPVMLPVRTIRGLTTMKANFPSTSTCYWP